MFHINTVKLSFIYKGYRPMSSPNRAREVYMERNAIEQLQFPDTLHEHGILLAFKKYTYAQKDEAAAANIKSSILLPLPEALLDASGVKIAGVQLGAMGAGAAVAAGAMAGNKSLDDAIRGLATKENISTALALAGKSIVKEGMNSLGLQGAQKGIEAGLGATFNPFQALTFEGVDLKSYTFDWTLAPSTRQETLNLQNIIKKIRQSIHPEYKNFEVSHPGGGPAKSNSATNVGGRAFLAYPDVCHIKIIGSPDGSLITFKPAMVGGFQVNYAGAGELAFLEGGDPAVVKISMNLTEMQIWTRGDYA
jgi:hypothetical protein